LNRCRASPRGPQWLIRGTRTARSTTSRARDHETRLPPSPRPHGRRRSAGAGRQARHPQNAPKRGRSPFRYVRGGVGSTQFHFERRSNSTPMRRPFCPQNAPKRGRSRSTLEMNNAARFHPYGIYVSEDDGTRTRNHRIDSCGSVDAFFGDNHSAGQYFTSEPHHSQAFSYRLKPSRVISLLGAIAP
jgi:hypothetical protein